MILTPRKRGTEFGLQVRSTLFPVRPAFPFSIQHLTFNIEHSRLFEQGRGMFNVEC